MKKIMLISLTSLAIGFILLLVINQYLKNAAHKSHVYMTSTGNLIIGGMASDKDRLESFKKNLEKNDNTNIYWDHLDAAAKREEEKKYVLAIVELKKATEVRKNGWEARWGLARLYEKTGQYDAALEEIGWMLANNSRPDVQKELAETRKRVEELKVKTEK